MATDGCLPAKTIGYFTLLLWLSNQFSRATLFSQRVGVNCLNQSRKTSYFLNKRNFSGKLSCCDCFIHTFFVRERTACYNVQQISIHKQWIVLIVAMNKNVLYQAVATAIPQMLLVQFQDKALILHRTLDFISPVLFHGPMFFTFNKKCRTI